MRIANAARPSSTRRAATIPATIAGYALVHGVTKNFIDSTVALNLLGGAGGLFIGVAALLNLNALGTAILSR